MYKSVVQLKRKPNTTADEFREWFMGEHAAHVLDVCGPHLQRYAISYPVAPAPHVEWPDNEPPFDIMGEMWTADRAAAAAAYAELARSNGEVSRVVAMVSMRTSLLTHEVEVLPFRTSGE